jgi:hypothetical protein
MLSGQVEANLATSESLCISPTSYLGQPSLEFKRYETHEDKTKEVYRPKGLLAFAATAREYVKIL